MHLLSGLVVAVSKLPVGTQPTGPGATSAVIPFTIPQTIGTGGGNSTVLTLEETVDLSPTGGQVTIDGVVTDYVAVDDDASTITFAVPLATAVTDETVILVYPPRLETTALVLVDGGSDPIPATIPHNKVDAFPVGVRAEEDRETVRLVRDGDWSWSVWDESTTPLVRDVAVRVSTDEGGIAGGVDEYGNVTAGNLTYQGNLEASSGTLLIDGMPFSTVDAGKPRGVAAFGSRVPNVTKIDSEYAIMQLEFVMLEARAVQVRTNWRASGDATLVRFAGRMRHAFSASAPVTATVSSAYLTGEEATFTYNNPVAGNLLNFELTQTVDLDAGYHSLRFALQANTAGTTLSTGTTAEARIAVIDQGLPALGDNLGYKPTSPGTLAAGGVDGGSTTAPEKQSYVKTYSATVTNWWEGNGTYRVSDNQYVGYLGTEGNRKSAIWFDSTAIAADLTGRTVTGVRVKLNVWEGGNGKTVVIGSHSDATVRTSWTAITGKTEDRTRHANVNEGTSPWITLPFSLADWASGTIKGLLVGPGPTNDGKYKFSYRGDAHANRPVLEITYE